MAQDAEDQELMDDLEKAMLRSLVGAMPLLVFATWPLSYSPISLTKSLPPFLALGLATHALRRHACGHHMMDA